MRQRFAVKKDVALNDFMFLHPYLVLIYANLCVYAYNNTLPIVVSSMIDKAPGRKSQTHKEGRAIDLSVHGWPDLKIKEITKKLNREFKHLAAISASDKKPRAVVVHDSGSGVHFHLQVRR